MVMVPFSPIKITFSATPIKNIHAFFNPIISSSSYSSRLVGAYCRNLQNRKRFSHATIIYTMVIVPFSLIKNHFFRNPGKNIHSFFNPIISSSNYSSRLVCSFCQNLHNRKLFSHGTIIYTMMMMPLSVIKITFPPPR